MESSGCSCSVCPLPQTSPLWKMGMGQWRSFINGDLWHKSATVWSGQTALNGILVLEKQPWGWSCFPAAPRGLNSLCRGAQGIPGAKNHQGLVWEAEIRSGSRIGVLYLHCVFSREVLVGELLTPGFPFAGFGVYPNTNNSVLGWSWIQLLELGVCWVLLVSPQKHLKRGWDLGLGAPGWLGSCKAVAMERLFGAPKWLCLHLQIPK